MTIFLSCQFLKPSAQSRPRRSPCSRPWMRRWCTAARRTSCRRPDRRLEEPWTVFHCSELYLKSRKKFSRWSWWWWWWIWWCSWSVWPDVELKRSPNFTVSSPKSSLSRYYLEWMFFKVAQKAMKYLDILWKIVSPKSSKNCPIWSHCSWWSPPQTYYIKILQTFPDIDQIQK